MGKMIEITVTHKWEPDPESYCDVEWPAGSGERRDLTTVEDIVEYEKHQYENDKETLGTILGLDDDQAPVSVSWRIVEGSEPQPNPFDQQPRGDNPFTDKVEGASLATEAVPAEEQVEYGRRSNSDANSM